VWGHLHRGKPLTLIAETNLSKILNPPWNEIIITNDYGIVFNKMDLFPTNRMTLKPIQNLTSQDIKEMETDSDTILITKGGLLMTTMESICFWKQLNKIRNVKIKNDLLRLLHGDVFYNDKLFRQGRLNSPKCNHCTRVDSFNHKVFDCWKVKQLWNALKKDHAVNTGDNFAETIVINATNPNKLMLITKSIHTYLYLTETNISPNKIPMIAEKYLNMVRGKN